jgi:lysyl-tRNA synthetase, class II
MIQVMCQANLASNKEAFAAQHEHIARGDIIGVVGYPGRTKPKSKGGEEGELSIMATEVQMLTPCLHLLPTVYYGFKDVEQRFRKRYLDLFWNDHSRKTLVTRSKIIRYVRNFLDNRGFLEVETPTLNKIAGGATAKPFMTYYNEYDMNCFMRIAPELYLKMLTVGGIDKCYEIGKQWRNESADLTHNPE